MPARIAEGAQVSAVNQGLEQAVVQSGSGRDGRYGKHRAIKPSGEQAGDDDSRAQRTRRLERTRSGKPCRETLIPAEPGDDGSVDGTIEPIRPGLVSEEHAEHDDEDYAASQ